MCVVISRSLWLATNGITFDSFDALIRSLIQTSSDVLSSLELATTVVEYPHLAGETAFSISVIGDPLAVLSSSRIDEDNVSRAIRGLTFLWHYRPSKCARSAILSLLSANTITRRTTAILLIISSKNNGTQVEKMNRFLSLSLSLFPSENRLELPLIQQKRIC